MMMPHPQNTQPGGHKFGFNGMESDDEVKGNQNSYTTQFRQYDARIGRWSSIDPKAAKYPSQSPYQFSFNNPIAFNDPRGDDAGEEEGGDRKTHEVKSFDESRKDGSLWGIASQYDDVSVEDLKRWNHEKVKDGLQPTDGELYVEPPEENTGTAGDGKGGGQKKEEKETEVRPIPAETDRNKDVVRRQGGEVLEENKGEEKKASERPTVGVPARNAEGRPAERIKSGLKPILIRSPWANTSYRGYKNPASNIPTRTITIDGVYYKGDTLYFKVDTHYVSLEQARDMTPYQRDTNKTPHQGDTIYDVSKMKIKVHPDQ